MIIQLKSKTNILKKQPKWKKKFAWFPVKTSQNQIVWLEDVWTIKKETKVTMLINEYVTDVQYNMQKLSGIIPLNEIETPKHVDHSEIVYNKNTDFKKEAIQIADEMFNDVIDKAIKKELNNHKGK